ncbi:MAG TPA: hypothetical protein VGM90_11025 [Kofleriaceae bacterium]|jgi:hypothetical protein
MTLLLVASVYAIHAAPPPLPSIIRVDSSTSAFVRDVHIETSVDTEGVAASLTFTIENALPVPSMVIVPITISSDVRVTNMDVKTAEAPLLAGQWGDPQVTRAMFEDAVKHYRDPGLLELVKTKGDLEVMQLHVFPVEKGKPAQVRIYMFFAGGNEMLVYGNSERVQRWMLPAYQDVDGEPARLPDDRITLTSSIVSCPPRD